MKTYIAYLLRLLTCIALAPAIGHALDNDDIIALHEAGLDESIIIAKMEQESADYDLSTDGLIALKKAGLSDKIIQRALMLQAGGSSGSGAAGTAREEEVYEDLPPIAPPATAPVVGQRYFTRVTLHHERGKHNATNYSRGELLPINTEVELISMRGNDIRIRPNNSSEVITIENVPKYTQLSTEELAQRYLADQATPVDLLPEKFARAIKSGNLRLGMTREMALMARGYPPAHETPSIEDDIWKYWSSRFVVQTIVFENDRLSQGRGIN